MNRCGEACQPPQFGDEGSRRGFALVLVVLLLALVLVVSMALTQTGQVETRRALAQDQGDRARQIALTGLQVALGRLQAAAGPDQRVSATAALVGGRHAQWTGVWATPTPSDPPTWLVSGHPTDPNPMLVTSGASRTGTVLVGERTAGADPADWVEAPLESIVTGAVPGLPGAPATGRFAYWVGDEGVKGCVTVTDSVDRVPVPVAPDPSDPVRDATERARLRQLVAHRAGNDAEVGFALGDEAADPARWQALERVVIGNQLRFDFAGSASVRAYLREHAHDFTVHSLGLLADTARGGLRANWSDPAVAPAWVADFDRPRDVLALAIDPGTAAPGGRSAQIKPVVTEWALDAIVVRGSEGANAGMVGVGFRLRVELWNPFPVALGGGTSGGLKVSFAGLPVLEVAGPGWRGAVALGTVIGTIDLPLGSGLAGGEVRVLTAAPVQFVATGLAAPDLTPTDPTDNVLSVSDPGPPGAMRCTVEVSSAEAPGRPLHRLAAVPFGLNSVRTAPWVIAGDTLFPAGNPDTFMASAGVRFHVRATTARRTWAEWIEPAGWVRDLRAEVFEFRSEEWESAEADLAAAAGAEVFAPGDPVFAAGRKWVVADCVRQRCLSVGALLHTSRAFGPPWAIGNAWGAGENRVFDEAAFNPVPRTWTPGEVLPNPRHRVLATEGRWPTAEELRGAGAARWLGLAGALNVNSVLAPAWTLALGRTALVEGPGGTWERRENPFFHFPQAGALVAVAPRGLRAFEGDALRELAGGVSGRIRERGRPFVSLEEFVSSGVLAAAIEGAGLNTAAGRCADVGGAPARFSPDFLTQAAVLQTVAPLLAARSDTFTIRAYGEAVNPVLDAADPGAVVGRAWCEAVVQRFPEYVDAIDAPGQWPPVAAENRRFGRRFRIVAFRWLTADDL